MATVASDDAIVVPDPRETVAARILRILAKAPLNLLLIVIAAFWLVPTHRPLLHVADERQRLRELRLVEGHLAPAPRDLEQLLQPHPPHEHPASLWITVQIAIGGTILPIIIASLAGYAFAWLDFPGRDWAFIVVIGMLVVPLQMALIPIFSLYNHLHLFDTVFGLILFHTAFGLPFAIFLLRNFFIGIPKDILESARIDGASEIRIFVRLILPLGLPAIASLAIFQFLWTWNDLLVALTMARNTQPLTVAIFSNLRQFGSNIDLIAPAAFFSLAIPLAVFLAFQRYFAEGLLAGSVK